MARRQLRTRAGPPSLRHSAGSECQSRARSPALRSNALEEHKAQPVYTLLSFHHLRGLALRQVS